MTGSGITTAMILAAGQGTRMRPLTANCPKPLLEAGGRALIEHQITALVTAGIERLVINHAYLGEKIVTRLGDGSRYGLEILYSAEGAEGLETAGGIRHALPLLGKQPFIVTNGDIWTDYPYRQLALAADHLAHLVLVDNPPFHPDGDFSLSQGQVGPRQAGTSLTFSGIAVYRPVLFLDLPPGPQALAPLLRQAIDDGLVGGSHYTGDWADIGTPERLAALRQRLDNSH